ncbi:M24 family metallopeptidase [Vibrio sp. ER1A]|uniref:M24 family metallopeptidase n=1 Tax=Vibrio sp. ER1A TaxID=1517681 RepID=UPI0004DD2A1B|nr:Xaa-Pro peptidase family protein [Vibrio sp. ER1A]KFA99861.1 hypothetical protein HW45_01215 [Vibrio sp. ER1A]
MDHIEAIQRFLVEHHLDAAILVTPNDLVMCCDYFPHWNGSILVVFSSLPPKLFLPDFEPEPLESNTSISYFPWATAKSYPWKELYETIAELLPAEPAVVFDNDQIQVSPSSNAAEGSILPPSFFEQFSKSAAQEQFKALLVQLRGIKTPAQIEKLRLAHQVANEGVKAFFTVEAGVSDGELAALIEYQIARQLGAQAVEYVRAYASIQSGQDTILACQFNRIGQRILHQGDYVFLELAVCVNGYWLDITRTTVVGEPSKQQQDIFKAVRNAVNAAVEGIYPGRSLSSLYGAAAEKLRQEKLDHLFPHALGHGTGFAYHDPGLSINETNDVRLEVGQVLTIEPGVYGDEILGGLRLEENIVVTETGYEFLSFPQTTLKGNLCLEKSH